MVRDIYSKVWTHVNLFDAVAAGPGEAAAAIAVKKYKVVMADLSVWQIALPMGLQKSVAVWNPNTLSKIQKTFRLGRCCEVPVENLGR